MTAGIVLRDYQSDLIARTSAALRTHKRVILVLATGGGKTACAAYMASTAVARGLKVAFICHRIELVKQSVAAFAKQGIDAGIIAAGFAFNPHHEVYVCGIGTLARRLDKLPCKFDLVIVDEAHHAPSATWGATIAALAPRWTIGLSATPCRLDGRGLGEQFDAMEIGPTTRALIAAGHLSQFKVYAPSTISMDGARKVGGDYNMRDAEAAADKPVITGSAISHYRKLAAGKRAVAFCTTIAHAQHVAEAFNEAGIPAASIHGGMDKHARAAVIANLTSGAIKVMSSCSVVSEGFDLPACEVAIALRPTGSLSLWLQQIGRVLRPSPGKDFATIIDHVGNTELHGFADDDREWSLSAKKKKPKVIATKSCPACFAIHRPAPTCPQCGHIYAAAPRDEIETVGGVLVEIDREAARAEAERLKAHKTRQLKACTSRADLVRLAQDRGYRSGWVEHQIKASAKWGRVYA